MLPGGPIRSAGCAAATAPGADPAGLPAVPSPRVAGGPLRRVGGSMACRGTSPPFRRAAAAAPPSAAPPSAAPRPAPSSRSRPSSSADWRRPPGRSVWPCPSSSSRLMSTSVCSTRLSVSNGGGGSLIGSPCCSGRYPSRGSGGRDIALPFYWSPLRPWPLPARRPPGGAPSMVAQRVDQLRLAHRGPALDSDLPLGPLEQVLLAPAGIRTGSCRPWRRTRAGTYPPPHSRSARLCSPPAHRVSRMSSRL